MFYVSVIPGQDDSLGSTLDNFLGLLDDDSLFKMTQ